MKKDDERIQNLLKKAMPPAQGDLPRDLWPPMLNRLSERPVMIVPWFDWALLAALVLLLLLAPRSIPVVLYHL